HTRFSRDWSSDVCSSDLTKTMSIGEFVEELWSAMPPVSPGRSRARRVGPKNEPNLRECCSRRFLVALFRDPLLRRVAAEPGRYRSEERRVGKARRARRAP